MIAPSSATAAGFEVHHRVPRCLLRLRDRLDAHPEIDAEGWGLWEEWQAEAFRYGVDPEIGRDELAALVEQSAVELPRERHRAGHSAAGDFERWGRAGGLETLARYGAAWFAALAARRWGRITAEQLSAARLRLAAGGAQLGGRS